MNDTIANNSPIMKLCLKFSLKKRKNGRITLVSLWMTQFRITPCIAAVAGKIVIIGKETISQVIFKIKKKETTSKAL